MGFISTVDLQTKMEVQELLSRFCHYLDHGQSKEWSRLFTVDGRLDIASLGTFQGRDAIAAVPEIAIAKGAGVLRHHLTNVIYDRTGNPRELDINAYCVVTDWGNSGAMTHCSDFHAKVQNRCHWQIADLSITPVVASNACVGQSAAGDFATAGATLN